MIALGSLKKKRRPTPCETEIPELLWWTVDRRLREEGMLQYTYNLRPESPQAGEDPEDSPFINILKNAWVRGHESLRFSLVFVSVGEG